MILQALKAYYDRKVADPDAQMAPEGFEWKEIPFVIVLDKEGHAIQMEDTREGEGKKKIAARFLVPQGVKKTSGIAANLLWDSAEYVLGVDTRDKPERVKEQHKAFVTEIHQRLYGVDDVGVAAVNQFLGNLGEDLFSSFPVWEEIVATNPNMTFRLQGEVGLVCQRPEVIRALTASPGLADQTTVCLVTGEADEPERLHSAIKGVWGAQTAGANIVSFNLDAFNSYGKAQGANAPVGKRSAFAYTTALNHLLGKGSKQRLQVGDASTVFWADAPCELEVALLDAFGEPPKDDPDRNVKAVESLYKSATNGVFITDGDPTRFYVLGLAPNAARIAVRFWHVSTVAELAAQVRQHFDDLKITRPAYEKPYLSLFRLLVATAILGKSENIPPNMAGDTMRSILNGTPYPQTLLQAAIRRNRAEQNVTYTRAALIKACLNRQSRSPSFQQEKELTVSLDDSNINIGYRLGRLFAVLEKIQEEASPGINATIRDRFYGAASSTPVTVFANLMKLKNHHLAKLESRGRAVNLERLIGQIMDGITDFPAQLNLPDQGRFAVGYYHQRQDFFNSKSQGE